MDLQQLSKLMSLVLRHKPETIGITLDEHGWADVQALVSGINKKYAFDQDMLEEIVRTDSKGRYTFDETHTKIRANQGHSIQVDVEPEAKKVGLRHGELVLYRVMSGEMGRAGYIFYLSQNGVWLTKKVPTQFLEKQTKY